MVQRLLGLQLMKGHGAADWSKRPLPHDWLNYAALDVEVLLELRDAIAAVLQEQGKTDWAAQEFEYVRTFEATPTRRDRWRRTSGIHKVRNPRALAAVRELWTDARPHRPSQRHRAGADPARLRDHQRRHRRPGHRREADRAAGVRREPATPQRAGLAGCACPRPHGGATGGAGAVERAAAGVALGSAQARGGRTTGGCAAPVWPHCRNGFRCRQRTWSPPKWCAGCAGTGSRRRTPLRRSTTSCATPA